MPSFVGVGGAERVVDGLSRLFLSADQTVFQASFDPPGSSRCFKNPAPFHPLGPIPRLPLLLRPIEYIIAAWRLRRLKGRLHIDATVSNLWRSDLISVLSGGQDRKIALCHINIKGNATNRLMVWLRPLVAAVYRRFHRVIAVNEALARELAVLYDVSPQRIGFIDNFVDRPYAVSLLPSDNVKRFVWCGRMSPEKNVDGLLRVWSKFVKQKSGAQLLLLGDGPLRGELEQLANGLGLRSGDIHDSTAQLVFVGFVSEPAAYMLDARALLLTSLNEGLPMVVLEALSLGLPVLASDCPAGGVRSALCGAGTFDLNRKHPETTASGALLPAPTADNPSSLKTWEEMLSIAFHDELQWESWRTGALKRASDFSPAVARQHWLNVLDIRLAAE
jgi:glycosyltransferase involved in cell wall biosynthesis